jgi:hypothetical protein
MAITTTDFRQTEAAARAEEAAEQAERQRQAAADAQRRAEQAADEREQSGGAYASGGDPPRSGCDAERPSTGRSSIPTALPHCFTVVANLRRRGPSLSADRASESNDIPVRDFLTPAHRGLEAVPGS